MDRLRERIAALRSRAEGILAARDAALATAQSEREKAEADFRAGLSAAATRRDEALRRLESEAAAERSRIEEKGRRDLVRINAAFERAKRSAEARLRARAAPYEAAKKEARGKAAAEYEEKVSARKEEFARAEAALESLRPAIERLRDLAAKFAREYGAIPEAGRPERRPEGAWPRAEDAAREATRRLAAAEESIGTYRRKLRLRLLKRLRPIFPYALVVALHILLLPYAFERLPKSTHVPLAVGSLVVTLSAVHSVFYSCRAYARSVAGLLNGAADHAQAVIDLQKQAERERLENDLRDLDAVRLAGIAAADQTADPKIQELQKEAEEEVRRLGARRDELRAGAIRRKRERLQELEAETGRRTAEIEAFHEREKARLGAARESAMREIEAKKAAAIRRLAGEWLASLEDFRSFAAEACRLRPEACPSWESFASLWNGGRKPPETPAVAVYAGDAFLDLKTLDIRSDPEGGFSVPSWPPFPVPVFLSFPECGCLLIQAGHGRRQAAMSMLFATALRIFASFPPGKAKFTIFDPIGLGQNFSALMHLADYDESIVGGRIWTDPTHIERKLSDLTEHMEKVIQKYLRGRYASIGDYNREAGQLSEACRFLVAADFPTGFTEVAIEKLAGIVSSGMRCGVFTMILHDSRQRFPEAVDRTLLSRGGLVLTERDGEFVVDDRFFSGARFVPADPPPPETVEKLLRAAGERCREAQRVEVPFEAAEPPAGEVWSLISAGGIRVPLGRAGADRLQFLDIGRGTAQHALIAGKTGSGKSTLFHVIITNAALWYPPSELEFYLIDFKKGVEFKTYASHRLPHARVVAIESDREFGISVLRRIDAELARRGEMFRQARVQDIRSYREAFPDER
ncbi:MAG: FtsK/SpoIIIE domain-containing protein, partial [Planctomycetota bacterium]|nr:FtsK/SpoIIIE domain-containing protein [Planctomycetota bacterium]